jgi:GT2 family glycosyltransferase
VVDDGSIKGSASEVATDFHGVRSLRLRRPQGFCVAANAGIQMARAPVVELLNDDTKVTPNWAEPALNWFDDPGVACVAPLVLRSPMDNTSPLEIDSAGDRYYLGGVAGKRGHGKTLNQEYSQPCRVFGASGSSAFYRRDVLLRLGAFPASFDAYFEDVDLAFRINRAGYRVMFEPNSRVFHRTGSSYGSQSRRLLELQSRNEERVFWRNMSKSGWRQAVGCHLAVLAGKAFRRWQEGRLSPFVFGRLRLLTEIGDLKSHRQFLNQLGPSREPSDWNVESQFWG